MVFITKLAELAGKKPPVEINDIDKFKLLNSLIFEVASNTNIKSVSKVYKKNILIDIFLILFSGFKLLSLEKTKLFNLYWNCVFEKKSTKKIRKYRPPNHWEDDLQIIRVGSKYLMFLNTENPVPVKPEIDSKIEFIKVIW